MLSVPYRRTSLQIWDIKGVRLLVPSCEGGLVMRLARDS